MRESSIPACLVLFAIACGGPAPGNFEKYTANEKGVKALTEYIQDTSNPKDARIEALLVVVQGGWPLKVREIVEGCPDRDAVAVAVEQRLVEMLPALTGDRKKLAPVRDAAFIVLRLVPEGERDGFRKRLAQWAFEGLNPDSGPQEVKRVVQPRILVNQVKDLGKYGVDGAVLMIRHGFAVAKLADYVLSLNDPAANEKLVQAFVKLHSVPDIVIDFGQLEALGRAKTASAVIHLLDITADEKQDPDIRATAFNQAAGILDDPKSLTGNRKPVIERLRKLLHSKDPDDRWSAARYLLMLEGFGAMDEVMAALVDDGVYPGAYEDPMKTMVDFCRDVILGRHGDEAVKVIKRLLGSGNRVHQALGIICVKARGKPEPSLRRLAGSRRSLKGVLGQDVTVGALARNAIEGIGMMQAVDADLKAGKLNDEQAGRKKFFILVDLLHTGDEYRAAVEQRYRKQAK